MWSLGAKVTVTGFPKNDYVNVEQAEGEASISMDCEKNMTIEASVEVRRCAS